MKTKSIPVTREELLERNSRSVPNCVAYLGHIIGLPSPPDSYTAMAAGRCHAYRPGTFYTRRRMRLASLLCICRRREKVRLVIYLVTYLCLVLQFFLISMLLNTDSVNKTFKKI